MKIQQGDSLDLLRQCPDNYFDFVVTDPPYGLGEEPDPSDVMSGWLEKGCYEAKGKGFMGKAWDAFVPQPVFWKEVLRVLKPGGHVLAFYGTRTYDWGVMAMRFAGFEVRDCLQWVYGSGFPKSHNVGEAVDKIQGNEREVVRDGFTSSDEQGATYGKGINAGFVPRRLTKGDSDYEGYGTALKPAHEPIVLARKPISEKNIALNCLKWGTGAINIDGCRVDGSEVTGWGGNPSDGYSGGLDSKEKPRPVQGRFPANFIHDGSAGVLGLFPESGDKSPARYFYCAKASKAERNAGLDSMPDREGSGMGGAKSKNLKTGSGKNSHPTVKPLRLMQYLIRLVAPPGDCIGLDPFAGSGSTLVAAAREGIDMVGMEMNEEYVEIAQKRIDHETTT